jgi:pSer/pThr/pTyr-binding forkhead associated (FHA) protein
LEKSEREERIDAGSAPTSVGSANDGASTDTTLTFTDDIGAQLAALDNKASREEAEAVVALPSGSALLVVRRGPNTGARFLLDTDVTTVGRHPDADIFLDDVTVSRQHAVLRRSNSGFVIEDQGSLNGTFVNRRRIESAELSDGDELQIGKYRLTFLQK